MEAKAYETIAQAMGGAMSTTGWRSGPPTASSAQIGDTGTGIHCVAGILAALYQRTSPGAASGWKSPAGLRHEPAAGEAAGPAAPGERRSCGISERAFGRCVPRAGNAPAVASRGRRCAARRAARTIIATSSSSRRAGRPLMRLIGRRDLIEDQRSPPMRPAPSALRPVSVSSRDGRANRTKFEVMKALNAIDVPVVRSSPRKDLIEDRSLYERGFLVEVPHPERGTYVTVASPIRLSDNDVPVERAPLLGEHTDEVLGHLGYGAEDIASMRANGAI